jgi:hypothetical protein
MTLVLTSLALLAIGGVSSLLLARVPRLAINLAMLFAFIAAVIAVIAAGDV